MNQKAVILVAMESLLKDKSIKDCARFLDALGYLDKKVVIIGTKVDFEFNTRLGIKSFREILKYTYLCSKKPDEVFVKFKGGPPESGRAIWCASVKCYTIDCVLQVAIQKDAGVILEAIEKTFPREEKVGC